MTRTQGHKHAQIGILFWVLLWFVFFVTANQLGHSVAYGLFPLWGAVAIIFGGRILRRLLDLVLTLLLWLIF